VYSSNLKTRICFFSSWGTYDWGTGEQFAFNLTRQLIVCEDAEDEDIWQLSLTFEFEADNELRALGNGDNWCHSLLGHKRRSKDR